MDEKPVMMQIVLLVMVEYSAKDWDDYNASAGCQVFIEYSSNEI